MIYIGIDPGLSGAIAVFDMEKGHLSIIDMPVVEVVRNGKKKRELSPAMLANVLSLIEKPSTAVVERVGAMRGQGLSSTFSFGRSLGCIEGALAALQIPVTLVSPQAWQKACSVRGGKDGSRLRAAEIFPNFAGLFARKKDDGRADAACMAWFAATK